VQIRHVERTVWAAHDARIAETAPLGERSIIYHVLPAVDVGEGLSIAPQSHLWTVRFIFEVNSEKHCQVCFERHVTLHGLLGLHRALILMIFRECAGME
jgi:hypothetical protein